MAGLFQQGKELGNYFGNYFGDVSSLFSQQAPPQLKPTREMTKNRLLDSIYNAEGEDARIPFGMFTKEFERRSAAGEKIPYEEARAETSRHIDRHIKRWEEGGSRDILNANARGLINANPEKNEAIIDGEWNPDFLKWYGEIYAPTHPANTTLRPAEKEKNKNWLGNVSVGLNVPLAPPQMAVPDKSMMYPEPKPQMAPIDKSMMYPEPKRQMQPQAGLPPQFAMENIGNIDPQRMPPQQQMQQQPTLQQQAQTAQTQPALDPFPWLRETYDRRSKVGMYPEKKRFKGASMYPPKKMLKSRSMYPSPKK